MRERKNDVYTSRVGRGQRYIKIIKSKDVRHYCTTLVVAVTHKHYVRFFTADTITRTRRVSVINPFAT